MAGVTERARPATGILHYQPALDGVRAVAVVMVLLFHVGFDWMGGGYFGVSIFFTLSGFLITWLLLAEADNNGTVSFGRFYSRRLKRLLPASLLCLLGVVIAYWLGEFELVKGMRSQMWGALAQSYNWVRIAGSSTYIELVGGSPVLVSPLEHYWSLAIEEQFYLVWPLTAWALVRWRRRRGRDTLGVFIALALVCAIVSPIMATVFSSNVAYWSTPTRLGELMVGAVAAAWCRRRGAGNIPASFSIVGPVALLALLVLAVELPVGSGPAYSGWMTPLAIVTALFIVSLQSPGPMRTLLSLAPFVWVGRLSYGLYLYHWPVFVLLRAHGWQLDELGGFAVAFGITGAIATVSFFAVERPIRDARWPTRKVLSTAVAGALIAAMAIAVVPASRGFLEPNQEVLEGAAIVPVDSVPELQPAASTTTPDPTQDSTVDSVASGRPEILALPPPPSRPIRILVAGDSTSFYFGQGLAAWALDHPDYAQVTVLFCVGCGFLRDGRVTDYNLADPQGRTDLLIEEELRQGIEELAPDIVVLMTTTVDVMNRQWSVTEGPLSPYDAPFRDRLASAYTSLTDDLINDGVPSVIWVVPPVPYISWPDPESGPVDVGRYLLHHDIIREVAAAAGEKVTLLELDDWFTRAGHASDDWRPDGTHMDEKSGKQLAEDFVGPWLVIAALNSVAR